MGNQLECLTSPLSGPNQHKQGVLPALLRMLAWSATIPILLVHSDLQH